MDVLKNYGRIEKKSNPNQMVVSYLFPSHFLLHILHVDFRLYGENDVSTLRESWVLTMHTIVTIGHVFNWGAILSYSLEKYIITIHNTV